MTLFVLVQQPERGIALVGENFFHVFTPTEWPIYNDNVCVPGLVPVRTLPAGAAGSAIFATIQAIHTSGGMGSQEAAAIAAVKSDTAVIKGGVATLLERP